MLLLSQPVIRRLPEEREMLDEGALQGEDADGEVCHLRLPIAVGWEDDALSRNSMDSRFRGAKPIFDRGIALGSFSYVSERYSLPLLWYSSVMLWPWSLQ